MSNCQIDTSEIDRVLSNLNEQARHNAIYNSLKKGGEKLVEKSRSIIIQKMGSGATSKNKYKKSIAEGYHLGKGDKSYLEVIVTALGMFLTKFFELGTDERYLKRTGAKDRSKGYMKGDKRYLHRKAGKENQYKKGAYRGKIEPHLALKNARENGGQDVLNTIIENLNNEINKLLK